MKLYVINLDRSPERLAAVTAQFQAQGLELTRIAAFDAKFMDEETYQKLTIGQNYIRPLIMGEVACFLSHRLVWQKIAEGSAPYAAVFEDDIVLSSRARLLLHKTDWIPRDTHIIKLETHRRFNRKIWLGASRMIDNDLKIAPLKSTHLCTGAYIVSRGMANQLLQETEHILLPVDDFLFGFEYNFAHKRIIYQLDPALVVQSDMPSILEPARRQLNKQDFLQTFKRKTKRISRKSWLELRGLGINLLTQEQWKRIPFDGEE
ncbi:MAG: Glycosyltransferase [Candidatus Tokpelaia hoelldobleri]|uniref:Glycosyltransferase n=1 Tax=Candidatus Tokpelaia hoelldobleri TaxID=1902579 RepID=A0A1U9JSL4_9HYPH|nr:MAG: Glycosyltransferase [Candidatus Tokpelaia hoelldoblerii]